MVGAGSTADAFSWRAKGGGPNGLGWLTAKGRKRAGWLGRVGGPEDTFDAALLQAVDGLRLDPVSTCHDRQIGMPLFRRGRHLPIDHPKIQVMKKGGTPPDSSGNEVLPILEDEQFVPQLGKR